MSLDDKISQAAKQPVPWDDLRERRNLAEFRRKRESGYVVEERDDHDRRRTVLMGSGMVATAAAVILAVVGGAVASTDTASDTVIAATRVVQRPTAANHDDQTIEETPRSDAQRAAAQPAVASQLNLSDGSVVALAQGANVTVVHQDDALIRLDQQTGKAHYEVVPELPRRFEVVAAGVEVLVVGTGFDIEVTQSRFRVDVDHGKVEVEAGDRVAELGAGDTLEVALPLPTPNEPAETETEAETDTETSAGAKASARSARPATTPSASLDAMLHRVDAARAAGDSAGAARQLRKLLAAYPDDPRAASAWFTLARVEKSRNRMRDAARAFEKSFRKAPRGALAEDALAEAARAWEAAGNADKAADLAERYLDRYENGTHRARMAKMTRE